MNGPGKRRFDQIFDEGRRVNGRFSRLAALPGTGKLGFATAKKLGSRPIRNRMRRRFQAALRDIGVELRGLDLVVIVGVGAANVEFSEVKEELRALLDKIEARWAEQSECS